MNELSKILSLLNKDMGINAIVLYGGEGKSFSAGGDFYEVSKFVGGEEVDKWIDSIADLYIKLLSIGKPVIAAVNGYSIGIGFQVALCADIRIASNDAVFEMPELKKGISCVFGGYMLERFLGRSAMLELVYRCEPIESNVAKSLGLVNEVSIGDSIVIATEVASLLAGYPVTSMVQTRSIINSEFILAIENIKTHAKLAHRESFSSGDAQKVMKKLLVKD